MDFIFTFFCMVLSLFSGILLTLAAQWYFFNKYLMHKPYVGPPENAMSGKFRLPQNLIDALENESSKKESCFAVNFLFQFLFKELRNTQKVQKWFRKKLSLEFEELLTRTTTGKLFDKVYIRDIHLGSQFPAIKGIIVKDVQINREHQHIDTLDLCLDLEYSGGFQLSIDANMLLGKTAYLAVKVNHLSGEARLQFSRHPYTHWSFSFYKDPIIELSVESQFQGRPLQQINSLIINQIRKTLKKKHTLPNFKLRYKPFFHKTDPDDEEDSAELNCTGKLDITVVEVTRIMKNLVDGDIYCSLAVDSTAWVELSQSDNVNYMTVDLLITKNSSQQLGIIFKQEFLAERYQACIVVDSVIPKSPAYLAEVRPGDIIIAIDGKRIGFLAQAARLVKSAGERFTLRVERRAIYNKSPLHSDKEKSDLDLTKSSPEGDTLQNGTQLPQVATNTSVTSSAIPNVNLDSSPPAITETKRGSGDSDSNSSSPPSMPGSPAKRPSLFSRSTHSSPEHTRNKLFSGPASQNTSLDKEDMDDLLQIHKTKELDYNQIMIFNESLSFALVGQHRYLNVSVWSRASALSNASSTSSSSISPSIQPKDILLGHVSIALSNIINECRSTRLGHHIKSYSLLPPDLAIANCRNHTLSSHSGFEPCFCYGDILISFKYNSQSGGTSGRSAPQTPNRQTPIDGTPLILNSSSSSSSIEKHHDFIRTHFNRTTQCEFCGKKIWLKDAVQCRECSMTCHKKCVGKCQAATVCGPRRLSSSGQSNLSSNSDLGSGTEGLSIINSNQMRRASAHPEIITTAATDSDAGDATPQDGQVASGRQQRGLGGLLASVASAAQGRCMKRAGSAQNLALPTAMGTAVHVGGGGGIGVTSGAGSASLPPSPHHSPAVTRKTSLVGPATFPHSLLGPEAGEDMTAALEHLLQHPNDDGLMAIAKTTGKELYSKLPLEERKSRINNMIAKLKAAIDSETESRHGLSREEQTCRNDAGASTRLAFLIGKSDEKVQALAVLMLHFCSGLQHIQEIEDELKKDSEPPPSGD